MWYRRHLGHLQTGALCPDKHLVTLFTLTTLPTFGQTLHWRTLPREVPVEETPARKGRRRRQWRPWTEVLVGFLGRFHQQNSHSHQNSTRTLSSLALHGPRRPISRYVEDSETILVTAQDFSHALETVIRHSAVAQVSYVGASAGGLTHQAKKRTPLPTRHRF